MPRRSSTSSSLSREDVLFDLQTTIEGFDTEDHWEITVTKVFAHWINEQFATAARLSGIDVEFKVNGTLSAKDAKL